MTTLENNFITQANQLTSKRGKPDVGDGDDEFFPHRPGFGTSGTQVTLWANYYKLDVPNKGLYKYDVKVTSAAPSPEDKAKPAPAGKKSGGAASAREATGKKLSRVIAKALEQFPPSVIVATEYKAHIISLTELKLPQDATLVVDLAEPGSERTDKWNVKFHGPSSLDLQRLNNYVKTLSDPGNESVFPKFPDEVDALNVILGHTPRSDPNTTAVGKNRFFAFDANRSEAGAMPPQSVLSILRGYVQSVRMSTGRLLLNTNVTHGIFRDGLPLDVLFTKFGQNPLLMHKYLFRARIRCKIPGKNGEFTVIEKAIAGLATTKDGFEEANKPKFAKPNETFVRPDGVSFFLRKTPKSEPSRLTYDTYVTVKSYFEARYGVVVNNNLPLVNAGTKGRPVYFLAQLCALLPGQSIKTKLNPREQDAMIQFACRAPSANALSVTKNARAVLGLDNNKLLGKFGVAVGKELITVIGRELPPPLIVYPKGNSLDTVTPQDGGWLMKFVRVSKPGRLIKNWTWWEIGDSRRQEVSGAVGKFANFMSTNLGININRTATPASGLYTKVPRSEADLRSTFQQLATHKTDLAIIVLPDNGAQLYNIIKKLGDIDYGVQTVCVVRDKIMNEKGQLGYFANVALKVNLKFGGVNHKLRTDIPLIKGGKTMVVGYDVTHPTNLGPGMAENAPSLVGLVASVDADLAQWPAVAWQNPPFTEELDENLVKHFQSRLHLWRNKNGGRLPDNILIFRDGVSEGQFKMVLDSELPHIRTACKALYPAGNQPRISLIVSVKRHQTRFYPTDPGHIHFRSKSPKEGTIVDRGVTNVRYWDFYLQAHASLQGTARSAHYSVLLDEIFRPDHGAQAANVLEKVVHDMCYLYGRATKAVSICPPAYYADLVCTRARIHKNELFDNDDNSSIASVEQSRIGQRSVHANLENSMYYI